MDWPSLLLGGGFVAILGAIAQLIAARTGHRRGAADVAKIYKDIAAEQAREIRSLEEGAEGLQDSLDEVTEGAEAKGAEIARLRAEVVRLGLVIAELRSAFPAALWPHLQAIAQDLCAVLDAAGAFTLTEPVEGGVFRWVSSQFAAGLGLSRQEFMALPDWRALLHPEDAQRTAAAESMAQGQRVRLTNRFRHASGEYVWVRWTSTRYLAGIAFSWVEFLPADQGSAISNSRA